MKNKLMCLTLGFLLLLIVPGISFAKDEIVSAAGLVDLLTPENSRPTPSGVKFRAIKFSSKKNKSAVESMSASASNAYVDSSETLNRQGKQPSAVLKIYFLSGSARIADEKSWRQLDEVGKALSCAALKGCKVEIGGHTDSIGTIEDNMNLSLRRAEVIRKYLFDKFEVSNTTIKGYGESRPVASNSLPEGREKNRRVVITRLN